MCADDENVMKQTEIMEERGYYAISKENPIRTLEYCEEQCKGIVEQLIKKRSGGIKAWQNQRKAR